MESEIVEVLKEIHKTIGIGFICIVLLMGFLVFNSSGK